MGYMVIVAYRPKPGKEADLLQLVREHLPILRQEGLATDRPPQAMWSRDGVILEIFEWASPEAVEKAHTNPAVLKLWERFDQACTFEKLANLPEAQEMFAHFQPVEIQGSSG